MGSGEWKEESLREGVKRGDSGWKGQDKGCASGAQCGRMERKLDHGHRSWGGGLDVHARDRKVWRGAEQPRGDGPDRPGGGPEPRGARFPGSEPPPPAPGPAGRGAQPAPLRGLTRPRASGEGPLPSPRASQAGRVGEGGGGRRGGGGDAEGKRRTRGGAPAAPGRGVKARRWAREGLFAPH